MVSSTTSPTGETAKRRAWLAVGLITLAALGTIRLPLRTFGELSRGHPQEQAGDHFERLRQLDRLLPPPKADTGGSLAWIFSIAAVLLPCWGAHALICACTGELPRSQPVRAGRLLLAVGTGLGLSSATYFLWLLMFGNPQKMYLLVDTLLWCLVVFICRSRNPSITAAVRTISVQQELRQPHASMNYAVVCLFAVVAGIALAGLAGQALASPDGGWDARAIWNLRARFLFRSGDEWRGAFDAAFEHTDYPLLVPATLAR